MLQEMDNATPVNSLSIEDRHQPQNYQDRTLCTFLPQDPSHHWNKSHTCHVIPLERDQGDSARSRLSWMLGLCYLGT